MAKPGFADHRIQSWGGLNEDENPYSLAVNELTKADNVARKGQTIGTRPGLEFNGAGSYTAAISGTPAILGIYEFTKSVHGGDDVHELVVVGNDQTVYEDESTSHDVSGFVNGTDNEDRWTFATAQNTLFAAGGSDADPMWTKTHGVIPAALNLSFTTASVEPRWVFEKWNYLFAAGMKGLSFDDNPMVVRHTLLATDYTDPDNWPKGNTIGGAGIGGLNAYGNEQITGLADFTDASDDFLLILTNRHIAAYEQTPQVAGPFRKAFQVPNGPVGHHAFVNLGLESGEAVYLSDQGIHSLRQSVAVGKKNENFLSWKIRKTFDLLTRSAIKNAIAGYWPTEGIVLFMVSTAGNTTRDLILALDIKDVTELNADTARWYKWHLGGGIVPNYVTAARDSDNVPRIYMGGRAGEVFHFSRDAYSDNGNPYSVTFETKHDDFNAPGREKTAGNAHITLAGEGSYDVAHRYVFDFGRRASTSKNVSLATASGTWGTSNWGDFKWSGTAVTRQVREGAGAGETIAHSFSKATANEPFFVSQVVQELKGSAPAIGDA